MTYDWQAGLALLALIIVLTKVAKWLAFLVPALSQERSKNLELDKPKLAQPKYKPTIKANQRVGLFSNLAYFFVYAPFFVTLEAQPWWRAPLDIFLMLMVYDFFYYLMHRFLFHGQGYFRRVHALHHQARSPTYIDAHYVHPLETFMGLNLFLLMTPALALVMGDLHVVTVAVCYVVYVQLNQINHCKIELPFFPYRSLTWISEKHAVHHENMHKGNYATITLLYDKLFGTLD
ncbi:MAG: sterol desaturase family protein [Halieaceae bacterium]|jgi:sterol desaturase/sphingolipid hydroxylase (fatty acid hydroxylase superfamily)|nr:sterol desaturase family protein [Halieaceae bacterium]